MQTIFVTGGTGLVGGHLIEALLSMHPSARIIVLVRSVDPKSYFVERGLHSRVTIYYGDIRNETTVRDIVFNEAVETVFHLAAQPLVPVAIVNPRETWTTNLLGTVNVLEAVRTSPSVQRVVVASSDKAYGSSPVQPYLETHPLHGLHPYDASKSCQDLMAQTYATCYGLPIVIARFGNIFGPGDINFNRLVPGLMKSLAVQSTFEIRSNGQLTRDFVYVKDVARGYILLAEHAKSQAGQAFNITSGVHCSVLEMIQRIESATGVHVPHKVLDIAKHEIPAQHLSDAKIRTVLGWSERVPFEVALQETWEWYRSFFQS